MKKDKKKNKHKDEQKLARKVLDGAEAARLRRQLVNFGLYLAEIAEEPLDFEDEVSLYPAEAKALEALAQTNPISLTDLAAALGVSKSAVSKSIARLLDKHLAEKHPQGRAVALKPTQRGLDLAAKIPEARSARFAFLDESLTQLSAKEAAGLIRLMEESGRAEED
jgi:DNA-binding MarR family transcriptional regulator